MGSAHQLQVSTGEKEQKEKEGGNCPVSSQELKQWSPQKTSFPVPASGEDEEGGYNCSGQAFSSVNSVLGTRTQPSSLLVVPVYGAASADRITFSQPQVVHTGHSTLCLFMAGNAYGVFT